MLWRACRNGGAGNGIQIALRGISLGIMAMVKAIVIVRCHSAMFQEEGITYTDLPKYQDRKEALYFKII